jgi:hypothetical protein
MDIHFLFVHWLRFIGKIREMSNTVLLIMSFLEGYPEGPRSLAMAYTE